MTHGPARPSTCLFILYILGLCAAPAAGIWTKFDLVRTKENGWGSKGQTAFRKINGISGNGPKEITAGSRFGFSLVNLGDLDGDGIEDLFVGAPGEANSYYNATSGNSSVELKSGAAYVLFMKNDGTVRQSTRIGGLQNGGPRILAESEFGYSVSSLGDLDGDGVLDLAIGAPGIYVSSVYIFFMFINGTARSRKLIRGTYRGTIPLPVVAAGSAPSNQYTPNGPELFYGSRFGTAMAPLGDWDKDGVPDLCVSISGTSAGENAVYMLFMDRDGTVKRYHSISQGVNGGPSLGMSITSFSGFGSSMLVMPDSNGDGVPEMVFGAKDLQDEGTSHFHSGVLWYCYMRPNATIEACTRISELSAAKKKGGVLPYTADDNCGVGVTQIGDINQDSQRSHWPLLPRKSSDQRKSVIDLVIGCPQTNSKSDPGRLFFLFLEENGAHQGHTLLPSATDAAVAPKFTPNEHLGASLAALQDLDLNGLREIAAGAPGDIDGGKDCGAVYVFYFRRRRWHSFVPDTRSWLLMIIVPPGIAVFFCLTCIIYFFYTFRRKPDEIEIMVMKAGIETQGKATSSKKKKRKKGHEEGKGESKANVVFADDF